MTRLSSSQHDRRHVAWGGVTAGVDLDYTIFELLSARFFGEGNAFLEGDADLMSLVKLAAARGRKSTGGWRD